MIGASKHKKNRTIPTIKTVTCPRCNKDRLSRYADDDGNIEPASHETVEVRDSTRYLDVCYICVEHYQKEDEQFIKDNLRKLSKAFNPDNLPNEEKTDHTDFSLN